MTVSFKSIFFGCRRRIRVMFVEKAATGARHAHAPRSIMMQRNIASCLMTWAFDQQVTDISTNVSLAVSSSTVYAAKLI